MQRSATAKKSDTKKGEAKKRQPDLRELGPRITFMYGSAAVLTNLSLRLIEHLRGLRFFHVVELYVNGATLQRPVFARSVTMPASVRTFASSPGCTSTGFPSTTSRGVPLESLLNCAASCVSASRRG